VPCSASLLEAKRSEKDREALHDASVSVIATTAIFSCLEKKVKHQEKFFEKFMPRSQKPYLRRIHYSQNKALITLKHAENTAKQPIEWCK
jgi:hypothetical protein